VSVFQVGIGFSLYCRFSTRFGTSFCCRFFKTSRYRFGIFGISLCVKAPRADPKILLLSLQILTDIPVCRAYRKDGGTGIPPPNGCMIVHNVRRGLSAENNGKPLGGRARTPVGELAALPRPSTGWPQSFKVLEFLVLFFKTCKVRNNNVGS